MDMEKRDSRYWHVLVFKKLKRMLVSGEMTQGDGRYIYDWHTPSDNESPEAALAQNRTNCTKQDNVLRNLISAEVISGQYMINSYLKQLVEEGSSKNLPVWWDTTDPAHKAYAYIFYVWDINVTKFNREIAKFGLKDAGTELVDTTIQPPISPVTAKLGDFTAHQDGSVRHDNKPVRGLKPQTKRLVHALIETKGQPLLRSSIVNVLWDEDHGNSGYLDNPDNTDPKITKRIGNIVSEANSALFGYGDKKHIVAVGETGYKLIA